MSDRLTFADLEAYIRRKGLDRDEYFSTDRRRCPDPALPLETDDSRWLSCYWVRGGSEGWYVHVDRITPDPDRIEGYRSEILFIGKFWTPERAAEVVTAVTGFLYDVPRIAEIPDYKTEY